MLDGIAHLEHDLLNPLVLTIWQTADVRRTMNVEQRQIPRSRAYSMSATKEPESGLMAHDPRI